jgi:outer membrane biosynthesis protein TonB
MPLIATGRERRIERNIWGLLLKKPWYWSCAGWNREGAMHRYAVRTCFVAAALAASIGAGPVEVSTSPRLQEGGPPPQPPAAFGGGEVALELTVDAGGAVTQIDLLRATPPFTDVVARTARSWRFEPAAATINGRRTAMPGRVLMIAVFRPPSLYAGPAPGAPTEHPGAPSAEIPQPESLAMPVYPPTAVGSGTVLVEIEMNRRAELRGYQVITPASGFDGAALDAVKTWHFRSPSAPDTPDRVFVYAVLGFRAPVVPPSQRQP